MPNGNTGCADNTVQFLRRTHTPLYRNGFLLPSVPANVPVVFSGLPHASYLYSTTRVPALSRIPTISGVSNCAVKRNQKEKRELKYQRDENDTWLSQDQTCYRLLQRQILQPEDFPVFSENTSFAALMWECNGANQH